MSSDRSEIIDELNKLIHQKGDRGLKLLFTFKTIKKKILEEESGLSDEEINKISIKISKKILTENKEPLEKKEIMRSIKNAIR